MKGVILLLVACSMINCSTNSQDGGIKSLVKDSTSSKEENLGYQNYALSSTITHPEPYTGIVFWPGNTTALNALGEDIQLEYLHMMPSDVVEHSDEYNWGEVESKLNNAAKRGHQCILRFHYTYPGKTAVSVPEYITNQQGYNMQFMKVEGKNTFIPDWSDQELKNFTKDFFHKLANRYDDDPRLAYLQVGFGSYAEYHLFDGPLNFGQTFPTKAYQSSFLKKLDDWFDQKTWSVSIDAASDNYTPMRSVKGLKDLDFGLFDDSFMHEHHSENDQEYNRASWLFFGENRYKTKPAGGEFSYYTQYDQEHVLDLPNGPYGRSFESFLDQYHLSYIIGNDQYQYQPASRIKQASQEMGYQLKIVSYKSNGTDSKVRIKNKGVAPLYFEAYPALGNIKSLSSLKGLLPGNTRKFKINAPIKDHLLTIKSNQILDTQEIQYQADLSGD